MTSGMRKQKLLKTSFLLSLFRSFFNNISDELFNLCSFSQAAKHESSHHNHQLIEYNETPSVKLTYLSIPVFLICPTIKVAAVKQFA